MKNIKALQEYTHTHTHTSNNLKEEKRVDNIYSKNIANKNRSFLSKLEN